jgi:glycosyltransferase involved in cell wall biosynthesis
VDLKLIIIGKQGWKMNDFADQLRRSPELGKRLHWLHGCSDAEVRALYGASSGLIMASHNEGFGLPIVEAFQAGLPVLARDIPVFREVAGDQACYFSGTDPHALAATLRDWAANGFTPRPRSGSEFTWDNCYQKMCAAIFGNDWYATWQPKTNDV